MKHKEMSYVVISKDEKTWMRLSQSRYGSKLSFTPISEDAYTFQPEKFETVDKARDALISYLSGSKTKTAKDFKIVLMRFIYEDIEEYTTLPLEYKLSFLSCGLDLHKDTKEKIKLKIKEILEKDYKVEVESFDYKVGKETEPTYKYDYDVAIVTNIKWKE